MKKLGARNYHIIAPGIKIGGTFDPDKIFYLIQEALLVSHIWKCF